MRLLLALAGVSLSIAVLAIPGASLAQDSDGDGVPDASDNCMIIPNPVQCDTNMDGYGNRCDGDFDDNGAVGASDFNRFRAAFGGPYDAVVDMDCGGIIGAGDFALFVPGYLGPPGPSGLSCAGTIPCP